MSRHRRYRLRFVMIIAGVMCLFSLPGTPINAQEEPPAKEVAAEKTKPTTSPDPKKAITTEDPTIPVADLELLLRPLTVEELHNEAAAWMLLLKTKALLISKAEIAVNRQKLSIDKQKEATGALETAQKNLAEAEKAKSTAAPGSPEAQEAAKKIEEAKANLKKAQEAVKASAEAQKNIKQDKTLEGAVKDAKKANELEEAKQVLDKAKQERDQLVPDSSVYAAQTKKIDELEKAIKAFENAKEAQNKTTPNSPKYKEASQKLEVARQALLKARSAIDGKDGANAQPNQSSVENAKKTVTDLQKTEIATTKDTKAPGSTEKTKDTPSEKNKQIDKTIDKLEKSKDADAEIKNQLLLNVSTLQSEQTAIIDRLNVILNEITNKGGDAESERKYIKSITAVKIDTKDAEGAVVRIIGWAKSPEGGLRWAGNLGKFVAIVLATAIASQILGIIFGFGLKKFSGTSSLLRNFIVMMIKRGGIFVGILLALTALEVSLTPILAVLGGASFVLAFALQSNLGNFASGLMLVVYKPFDVGDEVRIGDIWGWVDSITLASTRIKGWESQIYTLPNNTVWDSIIENFTIKETRRGVISIGVGDSTDLHQVQQVLIDIGNSHPLILKDPPVMAFLWGYGDYTNDFKFGFWTKTDDFWKVWEDLHFEIIDRFAKEGIDMPSPLQRIYLHHPDNGQTPSPKLVNNTEETLKEETPSPL